MRGKVLKVAAKIYLRGGEKGVGGGGGGGGKKSARFVFSPH